MKRLVVVMAIFMGLFALFASVNSTSFAKDNSIGMAPTGIEAVAVPSASIDGDVVSVDGGEYQIWDPVSDQGRCCLFLGDPCTPQPDLFSTDNAVANSYFTFEAFDGVPNVFLFTYGVTPNSAANAFILFQDAPVDFGPLAAGTYTGCISVTFQPVGDTPPLCNWTSGYTIDGAANGIGTHGGPGGFNVNCLTP